MAVSTGIGTLSTGSYPVVAAESFILATRETGYRNAAAAVAELIDNALQARASTIQIRVHGEVGKDRPSVGIAVLDDGVGMDAGSLRRSLQFGGSERFNNRLGFGRFGMGLPNSSLSQSQRVEVYSWQLGSDPLFTFLDVDDIANRRSDCVPEPRRTPLPDWAERRRSASGTLVVWPSCDRLGYRRISTVSAKIRTELGRIYRNALWEGVRIVINDDNVEAVDPLLSRGGTYAPCAELVGEPLSYEIRTPADPDRCSVVTVRFSILPVESWAQLSNADKHRLGVTGRAGVSIVRAGREIDYGWYFMGAKRKENYDDWWRCEIAFEPALDEYFRVTHSKQGVTPHPRLVEMIAPDVEQMARILNVRVRGEFRRFSSESEGPSAPESRRARIAHDSPMPRVRAHTSATRGEQFLPQLRRQVSRYLLKTAALPSVRFFVVEISGESAIVTINANHPFYERVYAPACENGRREQFGIECVVLAAARAELGTQRSARRPTDIHAEAWSDALAAFLMTQ